MLGGGAPRLPEDEIEGLGQLLLVAGDDHLGAVVGTSSANRLLLADPRVESE